MATSTDSTHRLYHWYLGRHSFIHLQKGNKPELFRQFPRLPEGLEAKEYSEQIQALEERVKQW